MSINWNSGVEEAQAPKKAFEPLPEGKYKLIVSSASEGKSKAGNDMVTLELQIVDGNFKNYKIKDWLPFQDNMRWKIRAFLGALGGSIQDNTDMTIDPSKWVGKIIEAVALAEKDGEYFNNRIKQYISSNGNQATTPTTTNNDTDESEVFF